MGAKLLPLEIYLLKMRGEECSVRQYIFTAFFLVPCFPGEGSVEDRGAVPRLECWLELRETQCAVSTEESQLLAGSGDHGRPQRELF